METNKIYNENNLDTTARMPDEFLDLTVTSPPYDNLRLYEGYEWDFERVAQELFRVTKQGGVVVWVVNDATVNGSETLTSFKQAIYFRENCGFNLHDTMIYWKNGFAFPQQNRYAQNFEYMFVFTKGTPKTANLIKVPTFKENRIKNKNSNYRTTEGKTVAMKYGMGKDERNKENIWIYEVGYSKSTTDNVWEHPAIFPEALARDHILSWSNELDTVYDPFMGSGTVAKMCIKTNRAYIGSEISKEYCEIAEKRIEPYKQQIDMFYG